jgi:hypothetical protein
MKNDTLPDKNFWEECFVDWGKTRGCAFLGKTDFDKLEAVQNHLLRHGTDSRNWVVMDCREIQSLDAFTDTAKQYRDTSYVIFTNCENVLMQDEVLKAFAHILDADEYSIEFQTKSFYVFLGDKNTIPKRTDYAVGSAESDHVDSFINFINCYDFDKEEHFIG